MSLKFRLLPAAIVAACAALILSSVWAQMGGSEGQVASGPKPKFSNDIR